MIKRGGARGAGRAGERYYERDSEKIYTHIIELGKVLQREPRIVNGPFCDQIMYIL